MYIGDAIMVHFGTPRPQGDDPARTLACAAAMITEVRRWNAERAKAGEALIGIGIGVHHGEVVVTVWPAALTSLSSAPRITLQSPVPGHGEISG